MNKEKPSVCILLSTFNGGLYINEQLSSIEAQTYENWFVIVSDDGSTDTTLSIVSNYQLKWGSSKLRVISGPRGGFCKNFLTLAINPEINADLYAFCDQDDIWIPEKLHHIVHLPFWRQQSEIPLLYCGRTEIVNDKLEPIGLSQNFKKAPSFENALVQSIAGGNTMVFNQVTKSVLMAAKVTVAVSHDWWLYQIVTGSGGFVYYDSIPLIKYRQHPHSLIGANISHYSQLRRLYLAFNNRYRHWNEINVNALNSSKKHLTPSSRLTLRLFDELRLSKNPLKRIWLLYSAKLYRQTFIETIKLWVACFLNKV